MASTWNIIATTLGMLREGRMYRGQTSIRLQDLQKLADEAGEELNPDGGYMDFGGYNFDPSIWKGWQAKSNVAAAIATTDDKRDVYHQDVPQGGTVMKRNYGGRVFYQPGATRAHANDKLGSTMDRYDVLMAADLETKTNRNGKEVTIGHLLRVAYSPSVGDYEERRKRLEGLLAGKNVPAPSRRPQAQIPKRSKDEEDREERAKRAAAERDAAASKDAGDKPNLAGLGDRGLSTMANQGFRDKMAKHDKGYAPASKDAERRQKAQDPDALKLGKGLFGDDDED